MRTKAVNMLVLALVLAGASLGLGQQKGGKGGGKAAPGKSKLEEMLAEALRNNADIRVAAAKLAEAEAELHRTRLQVTQKIVSLYHGIETQKKVVAHQEWKFNRDDALRKGGGGAISYEAWAETKQAFTLAKAKLEELEAQMPALLGKMTVAADSGESVAVWRGLDWFQKQQSPDLTATQLLLGSLRATGQTRPAGQLTDKLRKALQTRVKVDYTNIDFSVLLQDLAKQAPGLSIRCSPRAIPSGVWLHFEEALPVSAVLQALEDDLDLRFVVREYGILATPARLAPPGAMRLQDLLHQKPPEKKKNPPAENIEGKIKEVAPNGLVLISIGSDAGLLKGQTVEAFRLADKAAESKYLGTLRIIDVKAKEAIGQAVGRLTESPRVGDRVSSRILGK